MKEKLTIIGVDKLTNLVANVGKCGSDSKLQQVALAFLVHNSLYLPEVRDLIRAFKNIDSNGYGKFTKEEMIVAIEKYYNLADEEEEVNLIL